MSPTCFINPIILRKRPNAATVGHDMQETTSFIFYIRSGLSRPMVKQTNDWAKHAWVLVIQSWWVVCKLNAGITWNLLQMCWAKCLLKRIDNFSWHQDQSIFCLNNLPSEKFLCYCLGLPIVHDWPWPLFFQENTIPKLLCSNVQNIIHMYHDGRIPCMCKRRLF